MNPTSLIGIDCATDDRRVGVAFGTLDRDRLTITDARVCGHGQTVAEHVAAHVERAHPPILIALDAPLGWPEELGQTLFHHEAGTGLSPAQRSMFCRDTDRFIHETVGKKPLDVGADRIARTAHAALCLLAELRQRVDAAMPLAWEVPLADPVSAIEVYPAATLKSHGIEPKGYKKPEMIDGRKAIVRRLQDLAELALEPNALWANADALDAAVCLLAAADFLRNEAMPPADERKARREGWIWTRRVVRR